MRIIKKSILIVLLLGLLVSVKSISVGESYSGLGSGTENDPYQIWTIDELQAIQDDLSAYYVLMNNIDASVTVNWNEGKGFIPLGSSSTPFTGQFDGQGHVIENLFINRGGFCGLFGLIASNSRIKNIGLENVHITGTDYVGALVGRADGSSVVSNSYSTGSVTGNWRVGGLVGKTSHAYVYIRNSYSKANVTGVTYVGGLLGRAYGSPAYVQKSYSTGLVTGTGSYVGGLIGHHAGVVEDSFFDIETSGKSSSSGGTGKTTAEMQSISTFSGAGWDIVLFQDYTNELWYIKNHQNYPELGWQHKRAPTAAFSGDPASGPAPLAVQFSDASSEDPTGWAWYFGDETFDEPWVQQTGSAGWSARNLHSSVALPNGDIVLMGGYDGSRYNDVWRSMDQGASWMLMTDDAAWSARSIHTSVALADGSIVLMGGSDGVGKNDVWRSTDKGATWVQMTDNAPWPARWYHSSVVLPDDSIVVIGGNGGGGTLLNDVWRSTDRGATWVQMTDNAAWPVRLGHTSVALADGSIVLMGGYDAPNRYRDVWRSTDMGATWTQMTDSAGWSARYQHGSAALPDGSILVMGGDTTPSLLNDVWRSTDRGATWTQLTSSAQWLARTGLTSVSLPDGSIVLMGGYRVSRVNDVWRWETVGSYEQQPEHTYTTAGTYPVTLQAYNAGGVSTLTKPGYIRAILVLEGEIEGPVLLDRPAKVLLKDGTVISGSGPCFDVRANNVFIDTKSPRGARCLPGSPGIVVADGTTDFKVRGLVIDGQGAEDTVGILFEGAITDLIVNDILFRNLTGDALHFTEPPEGYVEIKGNRFLMDGLAVNVPALDLDFNAWGSYDGPAAGDLPEGYVVAEWTHVDVYLAYDESSRYPDEVALGDDPSEAITYHVYANLQNALGAQFTLTFDPTYLDVLDTDTTGTVFPWPFDDPGYNGGTALPQGVTVEGNKITFNGAATTPVSGTGQFLFAVTFSGVSPTAAANPLAFDAEDEALFGMSPGYGASLNIYASDLLGVEDVNVYRLPTLDVDPLDHYAVGNPKEFILTVTNPADGRGYDELVVYLDVPSGDQLQVWNASLERFVAYDAGAGVVIGALDPDDAIETRFRITFSSAGLVGVPVTLNDGTIFLVEEGFDFDVLPAFSVTGSVQMQGRMVRSDVTIKIYNQDEGMGAYVYEVVSTDVITGNYSFSDAAQGTYWITFSHDRYLDLTLDLQKGFSLEGLLQLARLELRGGNAYWKDEFGNINNVIDLSDASLVASAYGGPGSTEPTAENNPDVNFDGKVNIQDLALVGGNYGLTSAIAYADWVP